MISKGGNILTTGIAFFQGFLKSEVLFCDVLLRREAEVVKEFKRVGIKFL